MAVTLAEFSSRLRSLYNIDHADVPWMSAEAWPKFRDDPVRFFIRTDDDTAERIWAVVECRNRPRSWRNAPRDGDFSDDRDALKLLQHDIDCFPEGTPVKISLAPRVLYISWPNDDYRPDDGSDPYHCVSVWLAEGNIVAQGIEARRAETQRGSVEDESPVGNADAPEGYRP